MVKYPCKDCDHRHEPVYDCYKSCQAYQKALKKSREIRKKRDAERRFNDYFFAGGRTEKMPKRTP